MHKFLPLCLALLCTCAASAEPLVLALNWKAEPQFGGFYAAQVRGFYAQHKLDVKIVEGGSGTPTIQMLGTGKVDYALVSADEIAIAHARGARNVVALFASFQTNPQAIMTHAERGFATLEDVLHSDGTLLWQSGLPYAQYFRKKYAPLKVTTAPYLGGIGNFHNDPRIAQQCFVTSEPLAAADAGIAVKTFLVADSGYNPYTAVLATTRERLQQKPDEVKAMVAAVRAGWEDYLRDPAPANAAMQALNKAMSAQTFARSAEAQVPLIRPEGSARLGAMTLARWQTLVGQLVEIKTIPQPVPAAELFAEL